MRASLCDRFPSLRTRDARYRVQPIRVPVICRTACVQTSAKSEELQSLIGRIGERAQFEGELAGPFAKFCPALQMGNDGMSWEPTRLGVAAQSSCGDSGAGRGSRVTGANKATGERIRFARKWAGLNQDEVASRMGLSRASVSNWELGQGIKRENLVGFAKIVGVSAEWLMTGEPNLAPKGERASDQAAPLEIDVAQLERLTAAAFELLGKPLGQSQELAKAILKASVRPGSGDREPQDDALTKRLAQFLIQMYAP